MQRPHQIVFFGTPALAVPSLRALAADADFEILLVVTQPDRPVGRKQILTSPPVKVAAEELKLPVLQPEKVSAEIIEDALGSLDSSPSSSLETTLRVDFFVVVAFGQIFSEAVLDLPRIAPINIHFSLLPKWRGAAPIPYAIRAGDTTSGISFFHLVRQLDAGGIYFQKELPLPPEKNAGEILESYAATAALELPTVLKKIAFDDLTATPQIGEPSFAPTMTRDDGRVDWQESATAIQNLVRAMMPWPGAWTMAGEARIKILASQKSEVRSQKDVQPGEVFLEDERVFVGTGDGVLELLSVQPAGKKEMTAIAWRCGLPDTTIFFH